MRFEAHKHFKWLANLHPVEGGVLGGGNWLEPDVEGNVGLVLSCSQSRLAVPLVADHAAESLPVVLGHACVGDRLGILLVLDGSDVLLIVELPGEGRCRATALCDAANLWREWVRFAAQDTRHPAAHHTTLHPDNLTPAPGGNLGSVTTPKKYARASRISGISLPGWKLQLGHDREKVSLAPQLEVSTHDESSTSF